jgi:tRNA (cytidine32/guanosine34-2'-O)-methyltransferase
MSVTQHQSQSQSESEVQLCESEEQQCIDWLVLDQIKAKEQRQAALAIQDDYYRRAKTDDYRARSAYKLLHIDQDYQLLRPSDPKTGQPKRLTRVIDLCAAPGSWCQVLSAAMYTQEELNSSQRSRDESDARILAIDLQEMSPLRGVQLIQADITQESILQTINSHFKQEKVELIVCDGAPDVTGLHEIDAFVHSSLLLAALNIVIETLMDDGAFVAKIFTTHDEAELLLVSQLQLFFTKVDIVKPQSSRARSAEHFIVCQNFKKPQNYTHQWLKPFDNKVNTDSESSSAFSQYIAQYLSHGSLNLQSEMAQQTSNSVDQKSTSTVDYLSFVTNTAVQ